MKQQAVRDSEIFRAFFHLVFLVVILDFEFTKVFCLSEY